MERFGHYAITGGSGSSAVIAAEPVQWALGKLAEALDARGGIRVEGTAALTIALHERGGVEARRMVHATGVTMPDAPESFALLQHDGAIAVVAGDARGFVYALTELADRVQHAEGATIGGPFPLVEQPATPVRAMSRLFVSEVEDKPWLHDASQWIAYLDMLANNRFNRFSLALGLGYDYPYHNNLVSDVYLHFPYPYLLKVPGYDVRIAELPDGERDLNLAMLRLIGREAARRGLDFQLGLWTQRYDFDDAPDTNYTVLGVSQDTLASYCRDAVAMLLAEVPEITGLTFRIHVEGGISEGDYDFWRTVFSAVRKAGRPILIDMHAKGLDETTLDLGLETGMPTAVSPKYLAEHMGLPYQTSAIREREYPPAQAMTNREKLSVGSRRFMRQSYGDMLPADKRWQVIFRVWPGTQRVLSWGDPVFAAAYGRSATFAGADGIEWMEPLTFKGRQGSGIRGGRTVTRDAGLAPRYEWEKYALQYRLFGRLSFAPDAGADAWRRYLRAQCGDAAAPVEAALAAASRVLPLVTHAHGPSIANNNYWPEIYTNQPIVDPRRKNPYGDTPSPKTFGNASSFDPEMFLSVNAFAEELLSGKRSAKYSPVEVASWLEMLSTNANGPLPRNPPGATADYRRLNIDVQLQAHLGRFFAHKFRAGVLYAIHEKTKGRGSLDAALSAYRQARDRWSQLAELARGVYLADITVGELECLRGHWVDRLPAIEGDLADMQARMTAGLVEQTPAEHAAILAAMASPAPRPTPNWHHSPPPRFKPNAALTFEIAADVAPTFHYRHLDQGERWQSMPTTATPRAAGHYRAEIPADYTNSPFHLQYYFSAVDPHPTLFPGLGPNLSGQPYFILEQHS